MLNDWLKKREQFVTSVKNKQEVIIIDEKILNLADESISSLERALQLLQSMPLWCMWWALSVDYFKTLIVAKEIYDIEKNNGKQILKLKKY